MVCFSLSYIFTKIGGNKNSRNSRKVMVNYHYDGEITGQLPGNYHLCPLDKVRQEDIDADAKGRPARC